MKIRTRFVSNSSSTAFILDRRKLSKDLLCKIEELPEMDLLDRCTGSMTGNAQEFLDERVAAIGSWYENGWDNFNSIIAKYIGELGAENVIICRESDEAMGGLFEDVGIEYGEVHLMAEAEVEYH